MPQNTSPADANKESHVTRTTIILAAGLALTVSGCANRPDAIAPATIPMAAYSNLNCQQLGQEYAQESQVLAALSGQQNSAATGDAVGVFLVGVPMSSTFGGDKEGEISVSKGKIVAIEANLRNKGCSRV